jgi:hypothetical protein
MEKEIKAKVITSYKKSGKLIKEKDATEKLDVMRLQEEVAYVTISTDRKATINLGNYSSASVGVFCSAPALLNEEDMERAYKFISNFCEKRVKQEIENITGDSK